MTSQQAIPALRDRVFEADEPVKLTICCIAFNHEAFVAQCLEGFLDQRCDFRVEVVIYDDASTDRTAAIIEDYAKRHPTIFRTILMQENLYSKGVNPYFSHVFPAARGDYLAICDGDDYWADPDKLARQAAVLDAEPGTVLTFGSVRGVDASGAEVRYQGGVQHDLTPEELKTAPPINTLTACFRNIYRGRPVSLFVRTSTIGDLLVWAMLGYHGQARYLPDLLPANYRLHASGLISMQGRERQILTTAIARFHIAAYHSEMGDAGAHDVAMLDAQAHYNLIGPGALRYYKSGSAPLGLRLKRWRKAFTKWRKGLSRKKRPG
ncbi:MAG: glycosyltransferase family 2 protein [Tabrizicola flagellatus]|uniref:glycosyltransferase family 2 protein n=1 Tax=Tabrizicola flagellatus TaxID=2593021 RepID=UPI00391C5241